MAAKDGDRLRIVGETADLWFHCLIMLAQYGFRPADVLAELRRREGISGIDEKAARADKRRAKAGRKYGWTGKLAASAKSSRERSPAGKSTKRPNISLSM